MPELDRFYREAADKAAVLVAAPTTSEGGIRDLLMANRYSFPVMLDQGELASAYKVRYVPDLFVIDPAGNLVQRIVGGVDFARLNQLVDDLNGG
jgi:AhpC/TSA family